MSQSYLETVAVIERLHRRCLEVIKTELDRSSVRDINNIQALILFNIGDEELTVGELTLRGCYHGSNVSYNLKKLREFGYVSHEQSAHDKRSFRVKLTRKGQEIREMLQNMFERHSEAMGNMEVSDEVFTQLNETLFRLDRFWAASSGDYMDQRSAGAFEAAMRMRL